MMQSDYNWNVRDLVDRCLQRPADEAAWQEFVRRFHTTIHASVRKTIGLVNGVEVVGDEIIEEIIQAVYLKLIEDESRALKEADCARTESMQKYLVLLAIRIVREQFHHKPASRPN